MAFLDLDDRSGRIQLQAKLDVLGEEVMARLLGPRPRRPRRHRRHVFVSRRGELTLRVEAFTVLAKSLRPPPDKHHGLQDVETRFRRRELDLIANEESRELFIARAKVVSAIRRYLDADGFLEVETPGPAAALRRRAGRARSSRTTTRSTATSTCASPPSSTSSA